MNINIDMDKIKNLGEKLKSVLHKNNKEDTEEVQEVLSFTYKDEDVKDIINYISDRIVGQEDVIKTLVSNILYNQLLIDEIMQRETFDVTELDARKVSILLEGSTGTGKTAIINDIASMISIPVSITSVARFFERGYTNVTMNDVLQDLLLKAEGDVALAERGIIVFEEVDKILEDGDYASDGVRGLQEEIISLMDGETYEVSIQDGNVVATVPFDTSKLTFIITGNFNKLKTKSMGDTGAPTIGFTNGITDEIESNFIKNYINNKSTPEFMRKIKVVTSTKKYDVNDYKNILLKSKISPLSNFMKTAEKFNYKSISCDTELVNELANGAYNMGIGARGLQMLMSEVQNKVLYDIMMKEYKDDSIVLTDDLLKPVKKRVRK